VGSGETLVKEYKVSVKVYWYILYNMMAIIYAIVLYTWTFLLE
jgi:hypothetical protein